MNRYVYEATKRIPRNRRAAAQKDLEQQISDMCGDDISFIEDVLTKLGAPSEYARKYNSKEKLIFSDYHYEYVSFLYHTVTIVISIAVIYALFQTLNTCFPFISTGPDPYIDFFSHFFQRLIQYAISGSIGAVGIITILFAMIQKYKKYPSISTWKPADLPYLKNRLYCVNYQSCITDILLSLVIAYLFLFDTKLLGTYIIQDHVKVQFIEFFNQKYWSIILALCITLCCTVILHNLIKLVTIYYTKFLTITSIAIYGINFIITYILVKQLPFINPDFLIDIASASNNNVISNQETLAKLCTTTIPLFILCISVAVTLIQIMIILRKHSSYKRYTQNPK